MRDFLGVLMWLFGLFTFSSSYIISAIILYSDFLSELLRFDINIPSNVPFLCILIGTSAMLISLFISSGQRNNLIGGTVVVLGFPFFLMFLDVITINPVFWAIIVLPIAIPIIILFLLASSFGGGGEGGGYERRIKHYSKNNLYKGYSIEKGDTTQHYDKDGIYRSKSKQKD